jgi:hypothetical protein
MREPYDMTTPANPTEGEAGIIPSVNLARPLLRR